MSIILFCSYCVLDKAELSTTLILIDILQNPDIITCMDIHKVLKALANEHRLMIINWLKEPSEHFESTKCDIGKQGVCVGLIEQKIGLSQSTVSQYLQQLKQAGLITMQRVGQWTYCKLNRESMEQMLAVLRSKL